MPRSGVDLDRGQLAEWLGHVAWLLMPVGELSVSHVMSGRVIHADDTPVPVLLPVRAGPRPAGNGSICAMSACMAADAGRMPPA